ncbi:hypothetical protein HTV45_03205 [Streptomyces sp. CHD11]|uniref:hypothetical protein n=1 Tax=Streptomyces sp. CHD11 TaxID=2741325 RepID=UPI001BFCB913|nr:hypothetical protein [Streptomyces sp. CHD11]MBT3149927.1 hypothetical protein [Streptomyces sp. CHD11]
MGMAVWKRAGVCLTAVAVVAGVAGCQGGDSDEGGKKKAGGSAQSGVQTQTEMTEVLQAAFKNTSEAKSSKVRMTMTMPADASGGGSMELSGVQGWDPGVLDVTMKASGALAEDAGAAEQNRVIMLDDVLYMDMGAKQAAEMDGKRWMKMDFAAIAEASGDAGAQQQMTKGLESLNQDPAQQLALLLESPSLKHVGPEKVDGAQTQHYKGTLTFQEMADANESFDLLSAKEREEIFAAAKKSGMKGYDTQVWVNEDNYPVKMLVGMKMPQGTVNMTAHYSDYGAAAEVEAPAAKDTFDLMEMFKELEGLGAGA